MSPVKLYVNRRPACFLRWMIWLFFVACSGLGVMACGEPPSRVSQDDIRLTVLCYHRIGSDPDDLVIGEAELSRQLDWLKAEGYRTVSPAEVALWMSGRGGLPVKPLLLTFDDGYESDFTLARPALKSRGFTAIFFLIAESVGQSGRLSHEQVKTLLQEGFSIGSHSLTHGPLIGVEATTARREIEESRRLLEDRFGVPVEAFSYPYGNYDDASVEAVRAAGYRLAFNVVPGKTGRRENPLDIKRIMMSKMVTPERFQRLLRDDPDLWVSVYENEMKHYMQMGLTRPARLEADALLAIRPDHPSARVALRILEQSRQKPL